MMDTRALDQERDRLTDKIDEFSAQMERNIWQNACEVQDQAAYAARHEELAWAFPQLSKKLASLDEAFFGRQRRCTDIEAYLNAVAQAPTVIAEVDEQLWSAVVATVTVQLDRNLVFILQDGTEHSILVQ